MKRRLRRAGTILAWCGTIALVSYVFATTDFDGFGRALGLASIPAFLALAVVFNLTHLLLDSVGVSMLLSRTGIGIPMRRLVPVRAASYLLGFVNYNLAFVLLAAAAGHNRKVRWQSLVSPFLALNLVDLFVMGCLLAYGLAAGASEHIGFPATWLLPVAAAGAILALPAVFGVSRITRRRESNSPLSGFLDTFRALNWRGLVAIAAVRFAFLLTDATGDMLMLRTFNLPIPPGVFAQFFPVDSFACVLPISVAGIGPTLILMRIFFAPYAGSVAAPLAAIDAFSISATTTLVLIRTALAVLAMPVVLKIWKQDGRPAPLQKSVT